MVPVVTTFDARGESLDVAAFRANIQVYIDAGVSGIVVAGSSGEAPFLTEAERGVLVEAARGAVPGGPVAHRGRRGGIDAADTGARARGGAPGGGRGARRRAALLPAVDDR